VELDIQIQIYFKLQRVFPGGSITMTIQHTNTHITQNSTTKQKTNKEKQISSQSYTKDEGNISSTEYGIEKGEEIKLSLIQVLEAY
jgi:hypothetical protein